MLTSAFSEKKKEGYFFTDFLRIHFWYVFNNKIVATVLLASLTAFLWFS